MKSILKIIFTLGFVLGISQHNQLFAQGLKTCDLSIGFEHPGNNQVFEFGDTAMIDLYFVNYGPDTLNANDTIYYWAFGVPTAALVDQMIAPGDSLIVNLGWEANTGEETDTITVKAYLDSLSPTFIQTNFQNDTTSVSFVLKGSGVNGIRETASSKSNKLEVYPNPCNGILNLDMDAEQNTIVNLAVYNTLGREVVKKKGIHLLTGNNKRYLDLSTIPIGTYFLHISGKGYNGLRKVIKR